ncbi:DsrH like protein [compost metagenome]
MYALQPGSEPLRQLAERQLATRLFALEEDLLARAIDPAGSAQAIDYSGFVELSIRFDKVNSWL